MKKCSSGKRAYGSESLAVEALIEAHIQFNYRSGSGPVSIYLCDECGQYHLTSKGLMNERLTAALKDGTIARQRAAVQWQERFKKL